ncbi:zinc finger MYM-type protein 1-like [Arctopsyche grandis]|uniref:zinc finger MYM-type protein 1-like n=1 Tax=Arctopsyche grandis TaxID=121162 RepID=UPI00406D67C2
MFTPKRIKLSGAQYRKRRKAKEFEIRMQALLSNEDSSESTDKQYSTLGDDMMEDNHNIENSEQLDMYDNEIDSKENFELTLIDCQDEDPSDAQISYTLDPGLWGDYISFKMKEYLIRTGPIQIKDITFPSDESGRRFTHLHYKRLLTNGEELDRKWLIYSQHKNAVYCFCCKLFARESESKQWPTEGFSNWRHTSRALLMHEKARSHMVAFRKWKELEIFLKNQNSSDAEHRKIIKQEKEHCQNVLERFISIIKFLTSQGLSLRGTSDELYDRDNGNFLKLIELMAKFDPHISEHVRRVTTNSYLWKVNYMSDLIQTELIAVMATQTKKQIIESIKQAKYYSIIISTSLDKGSDEYYSLIVRFVAKDQETQKFYPREHFLCFLVQPNNITDIGDVLLNELAKMELCVNDIRCQAYDHRSLLKAEKSLLQSRITQMNKRAFILPSACHSLVSVVRTVLCESMEVIHCFVTFRKLFDFFTISEYHWDVLKKYSPTLSTKFSKTSDWDYQLKIMDYLQNHLSQIFEALCEIGEDRNRDPYEMYEAQCLAEDISTFKFVCGIIIWHEILTKISPISNMLQSSNPNLQEIIVSMSDAALHFKQYKQVGFSEVLREAEKIAQEIEIETIFPAVDIVKTRLNKRLTTNEDGQAVVDPKEHFIINFFEYVIDNTTRITEERLMQIKNHYETFKVFYNIFELQNLGADTLKEYCDNVDKTLREGDYSDIDGNDMCTELKNLFGFLTPEMSTLDTMNFISKNDLETVFPNVLILLRIFFTFPLMLSEQDGSLSKLDIIKNFLHSPISEENSADLSLLSIESQISSTTCMNDTIDAFTSVQCPNVDS